MEWAPEDMHIAFSTGEDPLLPDSQLDIILREYDTMVEQCRACAKYCVHYNPGFFLQPDDVWNRLETRMWKVGASEESIKIVEAIKEKFSGS